MGPEGFQRVEAEQGGAKNGPGQEGDYGAHGQDDGYEEWFIGI